MKYSQPNIPIFIINQNNDQLFNRGTLFNIGFHILQNDYDNFIFHDVDLLPININYDSYSKNPQHLSKYVSQFNYKLPFPNIFGGVCKFNKDTFLKINGFSNLIEGRGIEDDILKIRCDNSNIKISRPEYYYISLDHYTASNPKLDTSIKILKSQKKQKKYISDGISQLNKSFNYNVGSIIKLEKSKEYYFINVDFDSTNRKINKLPINTLPINTLPINTLPINTLLPNYNTNHIHNYTDRYQPEITIILRKSSSYNNTINSILKQTYQNYQVIINDTFQHNDKRILSDTTNIIDILNNVKSKYIMIIDEPCFLKSDCLFKLFSSLHLYKEVSIVFSNYNNESLNFNLPDLYVNNKIKLFMFRNYDINFESINNHHIQKDLLKYNNTVLFLTDNLGDLYDISNHDNLEDYLKDSKIKLDVMNEIKNDNKFLFPMINTCISNVNIICNNDKIYHNNNELRIKEKKYYLAYTDQIYSNKTDIKMLMVLDKIVHDRNYYNPLNIYSRVFTFNNDENFNKGIENIKISRPQKLNYKIFNKIVKKNKIDLIMNYGHTNYNIDKINCSIPCIHNKCTNLNKYDYLITDNKNSKIDNNKIYYQTKTDDNYLNNTNEIKIIRTIMNDHYKKTNTFY
jgi:hypothetical protein